MLSMGQTGINEVSIAYQLGSSMLNGPMVLNELLSCLRPRELLSIDNTGALCQWASLLTIT